MVDLPAVRILYQKATDHNPMDIPSKTLLRYCIKNVFLIACADQAGAMDFVGKLAGMERSGKRAFGPTRSDYQINGNFQLNPEGKGVQFSSSSAYMIYRCLRI